MGKYCTKKQVEEMRKLRKEGWTYEKIGEKFGLTRQGVQQRLDYLNRNKLRNKIDLLAKENLKIKMENERLRKVISKSGIDASKIIING